MKKYNLIFAMLGIMFTNINAQTLKKTFYDWNKTQPKEVYYVNAKGEKNGSYKFFSEYNGVLREEATYKDGILNGVYKLYSVGSGKALLEKSETFVNGVKTGAAVYCYNDGNSEQGNLVNEKKEGVWKYFQGAASGNPEGFKKITHKITYKNDEIISEEEIFYYFPSNKIYSEKKGETRTYYYPDGKKAGEETYGENSESKEFYPSGIVAESERKYVEGDKKISEKNTYYENGKAKENNKKYDGTGIQEENAWYENGQVKQKYKFDWGHDGQKTISYEGYNADGSKDQRMLNFERSQKYDKEKEAEKKQEKIEQIVEFNVEIKMADSLFNIKAYKSAYDRYNFIAQSTADAIKEMGSDTANTAFLLNKKQYAQSKSNEIYKISELNDNIKKQFAQLAEKYNKFTKLYGGVIETTKVFNVDVKTTNYPKGEYLFTKADSHYKELEAAYKKETDIPKGLETGKKLIEILDKLISLADTDTKDLDKKLKKAKTKEEEAQLLGF